MKPSEQDRRAARGQWQGWALVVAVFAAVVLWGLLNYRLVGDRPRTWDFGVFPDAPGESAYSTVRTPSSLNVPRQIAALPEADTNIIRAPREARP